MRLYPLRQAANLALDLLFPKQCLGCSGAGTFLCPRCVKTLPSLTGPLCPHCGRPLKVDPCPYCREWRLVIQGILSPFRFEGLMREMVHRFKYQNLKALAPNLAQLLAQFLNSHPLPVQIIVPVPLHPRRLRERGYNQSALLAKELGRLSSLPVAEGTLFRDRDSSPQARALNVAQRRANVAEAFTCRGPEVRERTVLLVDDVCTTGATLDACARALKAGGALAVWGLTLARET